jgi:sugar-phosphatase
LDQRTKVDFRMPIVDRSPTVDRSTICFGHTQRVSSATVSRAVLLDVDGILIDAATNQRRVWALWAHAFGVDPNTTCEVALRTRPTETFAIVAPHHDPARCLQLLHQLEDQDAVTGSYTAFDGAATLLSRLQDQPWALVTSNYAHRVQVRFARTHLLEPPLIVDAEAVSRGKPDPEGYLLAARALGVDPEGCLVIEDSPSGVAAARAAGATVWVVNRATQCSEPTAPTPPSRTQSPTSSSSPTASAGSRATSRHNCRSLRATCCPRGPVRSHR